MRKNKLFMKIKFGYDYLISNICQRRYNYMHYISGISRKNHSSSQTRNLVSTLTVSIKVFKSEKR